MLYSIRDYAHLKPFTIGADLSNTTIGATDDIILTPDKDETIQILNLELHSFTGTPTGEWQLFLGTLATPVIIYEAIVSGASIIINYHCNFFFEYPTALHALTRYSTNNNHAWISVIGNIYKRGEGAFD